MKFVAVFPFFDTQPRDRVPKTGHSVKPPPPHTDAASLIPSPAMAQPITLPSRNALAVFCSGEIHRINPHPVYGRSDDLSPPEERVKGDESA
ncbi:hypothetical protein NHX12_003297 [Muraenolepis orangiensis]|uniref:Uncharacterized protein n=1 Tax=Muraenolepis orangiensis TaxID=630683 RepID=A0A9Q0E2I9_9TELE|nr:hypothetical protein NHX12_003297 [Muraenolepis orangiensis]